jgi:hypothetical protein
LTDQEFELVFGSEDKQRADEEEERAQAAADDTNEPEWKPSARNIVCSGCGRSKHKHKRMEKHESKGSGSKMSLDDD